MEIVQPRTVLWSAGQVPPVLPPGARSVLLPALLAIAAAACWLQAAPAPAGVLWTETFEAPSGLDDGNWAQKGSAHLATPGCCDGGHAVTFTSQTSGSDLVSVLIPVQGASSYWVSVDSKERLSGGALGINEYNNGGHLMRSSWIFGDPGMSPAPLHILNAPGTGYHHYSQKITTVSATATLELSLGDWTGNALPPGHVYFDNLNLTDSAPRLARVRWQEIVK